MSRSLDQSRPLRAGRHRAEAAPTVTKPLTPTSPDAEMPPAGTASTEPVSATVPTAPVVPSAPRRSRDRRPAFEVPAAPQTAPIIAAAPAPGPASLAPETAPKAEVAPTPAAMRRSRTRREAVEKPVERMPAAATNTEPMSVLSPQIAAMFSSQPDEVLKKAASVRILGRRVAMVAGAFVVLLGVGAASQATELPFFGKESSAQEAASPTKVTRATSENRPTARTAAPQPTISVTFPGTINGTPAETPEDAGAPAAVSLQASGLPGIGGLPIPLDAPTLSGIAAATTAAAPPSSATSLNDQPPAPSSNPPAPASSAPAPAPAPATTAPAPVTSAPAPAPTPITGLLDPLLGTETGTESAPDDGADETTTYLGMRLPLYGLTAGK